MGSKVTESESIEEYRGVSRVLRVPREYGERVSREIEAMCFESLQRNYPLCELTSSDRWWPWIQVGIATWQARVTGRQELWESCNATKKKTYSLHNNGSCSIKYNPRWCPTCLRTGLEWLRSNGLRCNYTQIQHFNSRKDTSVLGTQRRGLFQIRTR